MKEVRDPKGLIHESILVNLLNFHLTLDDVQFMWLAFTRNIITLVRKNMLKNIWFWAIILFLSSLGCSYNILYKHLHVWEKENLKEQARER